MTIDVIGLKRLQFYRRIASERSSTFFRSTKALLERSKPRNFYNKESFQALMMVLKDEINTAFRNGTFEALGKELSSITLKIPHVRCAHDVTLREDSSYTTSIWEGSPMAWAVYSGRHDLVEKMNVIGVPVKKDPGMKIAYVDGVNEYRWSLLYMASNFTFPNIVSYLLASGVTLKNDAGERRYTKYEKHTKWGPFRFKSNPKKLHFVHSKTSLHALLHRVGPGKSANRVLAVLINNNQPVSLHAVGFYMEEHDLTFKYSARQELSKEKVAWIKAYVHKKMTPKTTHKQKAYANFKEGCAFKITKV